MKNETKEKTEKILAYMKKFFSENGYVPTNRDLCKEFGYKSTSTIAYYMAVLQGSGDIIVKGKTYIIKGYKISFDE